MLTLIILGALVIGFYTGARRGLVLQLVYTGGYLIAYIAARCFYLDLAGKLELLIPYPSPGIDSQFVFFDQQLGLDLDKAFYAGVAFMLILGIGWLATRFIGMIAHRLTFFPIVRQTNTLAGGLLGFLMVYIALFLMLWLLSFIPLTVIQNLFRQSGLARGIVEHTPMLSKQIYSWWISAVI